MNGLYVLVLSIGMLSGNFAFSQGLSLEQEVEQNSQNMDFPKLNVQGKRRRKLTYTDRLKRRRRTLEKKNEMLMQKRMETMRLHAEIALMKRINKALEQQLKTIQTSL
ncbi:MAG: hypothetical protein HOE90_15430 [Bacteriovoracaceae bacterium]|nr:hypothetical protein [Bacteriovoracaceae bacterium]